MPHLSRPGSPARSLRLNVDLTPVLPGGENGGAKVWALELLEGLARSRPDWEFQLLTISRNHELLAGLDRQNVHRSRTDLGDLDCRAEVAGNRSPTGFRASKTAKRLFRLLPVRTRQGLKNMLGKGRAKAGPGRLSHSVDLLFCPFTDPFFWQSGVPCVSLVHDLQYRQYPEFFSPADRGSRDEHFRWACRRSDQIVVASEFVKRTVLEASSRTPKSVSVIPIIRKWPPADVNRSGFSSELPFALEPGNYLIYPANLWPHKNHRMLLTAFGIYRKQDPTSSLKLLLTGDTLNRSREIVEEARGMGLSKHLVVAGYVTDQELVGLLGHALALIFPSLYEGFGMPLLEAMAAGVPVIASDRTAIPEVCDGAALLIDPRGPFQIADAMARVASDGDLRKSLKAAGLSRVKRREGSRHMLREFAQLFERVAAGVQ